MNYCYEKGGCTKENVNTLENSRQKTQYYIDEIVDKNLSFVVVQLQPINPVTRVGGFPVFTCVAIPPAVVVSAEWLVNGTSLNSSQLHNVEQGLLFGINVLQFNNVSIDYNNTRIQCLGTTSSDEVLSSRISLLRVQGIIFEHYHQLHSSSLM